jgi:hypothetical protein
MLSSKITDRHLRETYRYYKWFVDKETRAAISEWPEGASEKHHWKQRMINVGRDVRFLGRKKYQDAVEETIRTKSLTMSCGQTPTSWADCLAALFNPEHYTEARRELVYWIQFGLLRESNNSWIQKQESDWCASVYGIRIVYDKNWEGNSGHCSIDDTVHGDSFLPFVRARGSWFKWFFMKGANEIREIIQAYSLSTHGIYERICVSKNKKAEHRMTYTKRRFAHGGGYIAESIDKRRKQDIRSNVNQSFTMEAVTAWLEQQGKSVNDKPATLYLNPMVNCELSSVSHSVSDRNAVVTDIRQVPLVGLPSTNVDVGRPALGDVMDSNVLVLATNIHDEEPPGNEYSGTDTNNEGMAIVDENMEMVRMKICLLCHHCIYIVY